MPAQRTITRRYLMASAAALLVSPRAYGSVVSGGLPWPPASNNPAPIPATSGGWLYFTPQEATVVEALVERLIPTDDLGPGGRDAGCAVYIDRQLAGGFGRSAGLYLRPPFMPGAPNQGNQDPRAPAAYYRIALAALAEHVRGAYAGKDFAGLPAKDQDDVISGLERGAVKLAGVDSVKFFKMLLENAMEGFFADPLYGGNRGMVGWKLVGFPGARYDYRDWIDQHNKPYPLPPVGIMGRADWAVR